LIFYGLDKGGKRVIKRFILQLRGEEKEESSWAHILRRRRRMRVRFEEEP
jgi:hypothetical protein